jgi:hypothetical protein
MVWLRCPVSGLTMRSSVSVWSREDVEVARIEGAATLLEKELVDHRCECSDDDVDVDVGLVD